MDAAMEPLLLVLDLTYVCFIPGDFLSLKKGSSANATFFH